MKGRTLGVVGTLVWDHHVGRTADEPDAEGWGGLAYTLCGMTAALPDGWTVLPIAKVGADLAGPAEEFLRGLPRLDPSALLDVSEPNNRVELRYYSDAERTERLTGGVPAWTWSELEPFAARCDALYVNFVSGFELGLDVARALRASFEGPLYADLHSLFLAIDETGLRVPRPLAAGARWVECFDAVQLNEVELGLVSRWKDPWAYPAATVAGAPRLFLVTLGGRGAAYVASPGLEPDPMTWGPADRAPATRQANARVVTVPTEPRPGDPTGCGDVWGGVLFARLLGGATFPEAIGEANRAAGAKLPVRGAEGLHEVLRRALEHREDREQVREVG